MPRSAPAFFLLASLLLWSWCFWLLKFPYIGDIWDDGNYVVSAQALEDGKGYMLPSRPGPPGRPKYPIGFPAILAVAGAGHGGARAFAVEAAAAWVLAFGIFVWLRRLDWSGWAAAVGSAAAIFAPLPRNRNVMADLPLCAITAILFARWRRRAGTASSFADGALAAVAFLIRRPGIALLPAALLSRGGQVSKRAVIAGFLLVDLPIEWFAARFPNTLNEVYLSEAVRFGWGGVRDFAGVALRNLAGLIYTIPETAAPFVYSTVVRNLSGLAVLAATAILCLALGVGVRALHRKWQDALTPVWVFCVLTLGVIVIWPWEVGARLGMPLAPVAVLAIGCGVATLRSRSAAIAAWTVLLCGNLALTARVVHNARSEPRAVDLAQTFDFVRRNTPSNAVLISEAPEMMYLYTGRQSIPMLDVIDWDRPGSIESMKRWLPRAAGRPLYAVGACVAPPDPIAVQSRALIADPSFAVRELFRTADCRFTVSSVALR